MEMYLTSEDNFDSKLVKRMHKNLLESREKEKKDTDQTVNALIWDRCEF